MATADDDFIQIVEISNATGLASADILAKAIENKVMILAKLDGEIVLWTNKRVEISEPEHTAQLGPHELSLDSFQPWSLSAEGEADDEERWEGRTHDQWQLDEASERQRQAFALQYQQRNAEKFTRIVRLCDVTASASGTTWRVAHVLRWLAARDTDDLPYGLILDDHFRPDVALSAEAIGLTRAGWKTIAHKAHLPLNDTATAKKRAEEQQSSKSAERQDDLKLIADLQRLVALTKAYPRGKANVHLSKLAKKIAVDTTKIDPQVVESSEVSRLRNRIGDAVRLVAAPSDVVASAPLAIIGALATCLKDPLTAPNRVRVKNRDGIAEFTSELCNAQGLVAAQYQKEAILAVLKAAQKY